MVLRYINKDFYALKEDLIEHLKTVHYYYNFKPKCSKHIWIREKGNLH